MKKKSVQSINQWQSLPVRQAGVIQTSYDIVKAHGGEIRVVPNEARPNEQTGKGEGTEFIIEIPILSN